MKGTVWIGKEGIYVDGELMAIAYPQMPIPDLEACRIYWDEATQSVKQETIPLADMHNATKGLGHGN
jgi:hypothetical protein